MHRLDGAANYRQNGPAWSNLLYSVNTHTPWETAMATKEYWDHIYATPTHMGGFCLGLDGSGLKKPIPKAFKKNIGVGPVKSYALAYGGWEKHKYHHDSSFCMNGLIAADWTPAGTFALKKVHENVIVDSISLKEGRFIIHNRFDYSNLKEMVTGKWVLTCNGEAM